MKKLLLLLALGGAGYYYYTEHYAHSASGPVDSYQALLKKVETTPVTRDEVILGSNRLAAFFCADEEFQRSGGSTPAQCDAKRANYKEICESRVFGTAPDTYSRKEDVVAVAKSYTACVGIK